MLEARALAPAAPLYPFADDMAGAEYLCSDAHLRTLVATICASFAKGDGIALLAGDPPADGELLARHFEERSEGAYRATLLRCSPGMGFVDLLVTCLGKLGLADDSSGADDDVKWKLLTHLMQESRDGMTRVLVIDAADALELEAFDQLCEFSRLNEPRIMPVVLLGTHSGLAKLEAGAPEQRPFSRFAVERLEREEVGAFIDRQLRLRSGDPQACFSSEDVAAIAAAANGDPATVNRLARLAMSRAEPGPTQPVAPTEQLGTAPAEPSAAPLRPAPLPDGAKRAATVTELRRRMKSSSRVARSPVLSRWRDASAAMRIGVLASLSVGVLAIGGAALLGVLRSDHRPEAANATPEQHADAPPTAEQPAQEGLPVEKDSVVALQPIEEPPPSALAPETPPPTAPEKPVATASTAPEQDATPQPPTEQPTVSAVPPPSPASHGRTYRLQLGSLRTPEAAASEWEAIRRRHGDLLGPLSYSLQRVDLGPRGLFYRLQAGPITDAAEAERACAELKRLGEGCIVVKS